MTKSALRLPRLYAIIDATRFAEKKDPTQALLQFARGLADGGARLLQYRNKTGSTMEMLSHARELKRVLGTRVRVIINDRADLCLATGCEGVHLGQDDVSPAGARKVLGEDRTIGLSTHNLEQAMAAEASEADYIAIGPIFATQSKERPDPVVGIAALKKIRKRVHKPLVAIGGITRANCQEVTAAGADAVAVVADLVDTSGQDSPRSRVEDFLRRLE